MAWQFKLLGAGAKKYFAKVDKTGSLQVKQGQVPCVPFFQYLTSTGLSSGSKEMATTAGTLAVPLKFFLPASPTRVRVITGLKFLVSGVSATLEEFGTGTALTNGCVLQYTDAKTGTVQIKNDIKTNFDLVNLALYEPAFGTGSDAFRSPNAIGTPEVYTPVLNLAKIMPLTNGIRLDPRSGQEIVMLIRDNTLTAKAQNFWCEAVGYEELAEGEI